MVISLVVFGAYTQVRPPRAQEDDVFANSVAVLPFADMSAEKDQEYFGDGITEEILNTLVQLPELRVPARTSSFSFKGKNLPVSEIAKQLGVAHILEGSVRKAGNRVRITAQLIDARTDKHVWSQQYDRDLDDVFAVQGEIARAIVEAMQVQFKGGQPQLTNEETGSGRAHELYLKGLFHWHRRRSAEMPLALDHFRAATREDPDYAEAWAGLALTYAVLPQYSSFDVKQAIREGKAAAARALELDPKNAEAHAALGQIAQELEWDWKSARTHLDEALRLDPRSATVHQWRAELFLVLGREDEALGEIDRALELDPLSSVMQNVRGLSLVRAGRTEEGLGVLRAITQRDPDYFAAHGNLAVRLALLGRMQEAVQAARPDSRLQQLLRGVSDTTLRAQTLATMSDPEVRATRGTAWPFTMVYLALGEPDSAARILEVGATRWDPSLAFYANDPASRPLQQLPAFRSYLKLVHLDR
jgi:adenylate cyclase